MSEWTKIDDADVVPGFYWIAFEDNVFVVEVTEDRGGDFWIHAIGEERPTSLVDFPRNALLYGPLEFPDLPEERAT